MNVVVMPECDALHSNDACHDSSWVHLQVEDYADDSGHGAEDPQEKDVHGGNVKDEHKHEELQNQL